MSLGNIFLIVVLIGLNAFFVGVEFAVVSSRRSRLDIQADASSRGAGLVRTWLEQPASRDRLIAASQLGITIVSLALGAVGENTFEAALEPYFHEISLPANLAFLQRIIPGLPLAISLIIVTSFHVVLGEQVPKVAVLRSPERFAVASAPVMEIFGKVFRGFINVLDAATRGILSLIGIPPSSAHSSMFSLEEFKQMVSGPEVEGMMEKEEQEMLSAIIDFGELVVRQISVPRTEIIATPATADLSSVIQMAAEHSVTKLPVYEDDLDHVIGVIHLRDVLFAVQKVLDGSLDTQTKQTARDLAREALFVPETISVNDLLIQFRARRTHIAIVLDEFGGTAGLVTLEDLLEEIVGDVQGPFDAAPAIQAQPDGTASIDGLTPIEDINEYFSLNLSDPNYDTIAGYILGKLGRIPQPGDTVEDPENQVLLRVETMDRLRIARILLSHLPKPQ
ncbi:MAG TPA: hemolysin family protein [Anaerolineaceae bacterium]